MPSKTHLVRNVTTLVIFWCENWQQASARTLFRSATLRNRTVRVSEWEPRFVALAVSEQPNLALFSGEDMSPCFIPVSFSFPLPDPAISNQHLIIPGHFHSARSPLRTDSEQTDSDAPSNLHPHRCRHCLQPAPFLPSWFPGCCSTTSLPLFTIYCLFYFSSWPHSFLDTSLTANAIISLDGHAFSSTSFLAVSPPATGTWYSNCCPSAASLPPGRGYGNGRYSGSKPSCRSTVPWSQAMCSW